MSYPRLRELQLVELEILLEVDRICRENSIEYFLDCGTALGAVRHEGFIPWDDDIDIGMTRDNYEKFIEIVPVKMKGDFFLQTTKTDNSPYLYAKVRKNNTIFMEWNKRNLDMHHGIYIDIFPYDNVPDNIEERNKYLNKCRKIYRLYLLRSTPDRDVPPKKSVKWIALAILRRLIHYVFRVIPMQLIENETIQVFKKYNKVETEYLACQMFNEIVYCKRDLFPLKQIKFENHLFPCVNNVDKFLTILYGDYMKLPPIEKRTGHKPYKLEF